MRRAGRFSFCAAVVAMFVMATQSAIAQSWPQRPVRVIVTLGAGSSSDITARMLAERLSKRWGQPVVIENRPGADGMIAANSFLSARDDHSLLMGPSAVLTVNPLIHAKLAYDPVNDLVPVSS